MSFIRMVTVLKEFHPLGAKVLDHGWRENSISTRRIGQQNNGCRQIRDDSEFDNLLLTYVSELGR